jgi:hypothetical protein
MSQQLIPTEQTQVKLPALSWEGTAAQNIFNQLLTLTNDDSTPIIPITPPPGVLAFTIYVKVDDSGAVQKLDLVPK